MRVIALVALLAASGCAARTAEVAAPTMGLDADPQIVADQHEELVTLSSEVEQLASAADCAGACDAGARLCALRDRICDIASRHEGDVEIEGRCTDGRMRCERARTRLAEACGCPIPSE